MRAPDVAFVGRARAPGIPATGYAPFAPDLAVEIISPSDRPGELLANVGQLLEAGSTLVWVIDPIRTEARAYRADDDLTIIPAGGRLDGDVVLPGFRCPLADVFR